MSVGDAFRSAVRENEQETGTIRSQCSASLTRVYRTRGSIERSNHSSPSRPHPNARYRLRRLLLPLLLPDCTFQAVLGCGEGPSFCEEEGQGLHRQRQKLAPDCKRLTLKPCPSDSWRAASRSSGVRPRRYISSMKRRSCVPPSTCISISDTTPSSLARSMAFFWRTRRLDIRSKSNRVETHQYKPAPPPPPPKKKPKPMFLLRWTIV